MTRRILTLAIVVALSAAMALPAGAGNDRVTYGDVSAHFQTAEGGGAVAFQTGTLAGFSAPGNIFDHSIRPFPGSPWDGRHICEDDWHLLAIALFDGSPDRSYSRTDFDALVQGLTVDLILDGTVLSEPNQQYRSGLSRLSTTTSLRGTGFRQERLLLPTT